MNNIMHSLSRNARISNLLLTGSTLVFALVISGCGPSEYEPADIYTDDVCANCRMHITQLSFASEIITDKNTYKFDDLGCMVAFKSRLRKEPPRAIFVKDFYSRRWLRYEKAIILQTMAASPMGSGMVAFADSVGAKKFQKEVTVRAH